MFAILHLQKMRRRCSGLKRVGQKFSMDPT